MRTFFQGTCQNRSNALLGVHSEIKHNKATTVQGHNLALLLCKSQTKATLVLLALLNGM